MAGNGFAPKQAGRRSHDSLARGDWQAAGAVGWQHGEVPDPPARLSKAALEAWNTWFSAWYAAHWDVEDLPVLRVIGQLYSKVYAGRATGSERSEFRQLADSMGITKKGQQDRRWKPPASASDGKPATTPTPYGHLSVVENAG